MEHEQEYYYENGEGYEHSDDSTNKRRSFSLRDFKNNTKDLDKYK